MFPAFAPEEQNNQKAIEALMASDPVTVDTSVSTDEALDFLDLLDGGTLSIADLTMGDI